ncbi:hypothetical protein O181_070010 [Austropuccinia psidii MF-1]|uniref:Uncharacterized protein n=1 Tax=Austropuccinia psidii MF-1 TaxID=1389203 RepID=A0A9Q3EVL5_9BASI|nr:hypothetical protein [Austropuccinia psidii MF-1]
MEQLPNGSFNFSSGDQDMSSRGFIKAQREVSISNTNEAFKQSFVILIHNIPPKEYWQFILKGYSRGCPKTICQTWTPFPREDSQTFQAGFPLVWHNSIYLGLCDILSTVLKKQEYSSQEVWNPQTSEIPKGPWICLPMEFITQLPLSSYFDTTLVIVDRF